MDKLFSLVLVALIILEGFFLGFDSARGDVHGAIADGILLAFWTIFLLFVHFKALSRADVADRLSRIMDNAMHDVTHFIKRKAEEQVNAKEANRPNPSRGQTSNRKKATTNPGSGTKNRSGSSKSNSTVRSGSKGTSKKVRS